MSAPALMPKANGQRSLHGRRTMSQQCQNDSDQGNSHHKDDGATETVELRVDFAASGPDPGADQRSQVEQRMFDPLNAVLTIGVDARRSRSSPHGTFPSVDLARYPCAPRPRPVPEAVLASRTALLAGMVVGICAEYEAQVEAGTNRGTWTQVGWFLIDAAAGMMSAPGRIPTLGSRSPTSRCSELFPGQPASGGRHPGVGSAEFRPSVNSSGSTAQGLRRVGQLVSGPA